MTGEKPQVGGREWCKKKCVKNRKQLTQKTTTDCHKHVLLGDKGNRREARGKKEQEAKAGSPELNKKKNGSKTTSNRDGNPLKPAGVEMRSPGNYDNWTGGKRRPANTIAIHGGWNKGETRTVTWGLRKRH